MGKILLILTVIFFNFGCASTQDLNMSSKSHERYTQRSVAQTGTFGAPVSKDASKKLQDAKYRRLFNETVQISNGELDPCILSPLENASKKIQLEVFIKLLTSNEKLNDFSEKIKGPEISLEQIQGALGEISNCTN